MPHSLKTYREDAWRKFYIFDVSVDEGGDHKYLSYDEYKPLLDKYGFNYIPTLVEINNPSYDQLIKYLDENQFLIEDGKGAGEGIVIKNYDFVNKYGRVVWAKLVTSEFRDKPAKEMGHAKINGARMIESDIADEYVTQALCDKVMAKIVNSLTSDDEVQNRGFTSKDIPRYLNTVFYDVVKEESWNFVKKYNNPSINFKTLQHFVFEKAKSFQPLIFGIMK